MNAMQHAAAGLVACSNTVMPPAHVICSKQPASMLRSRQPLTHSFGRLQQQPGVTRRSQVPRLMTIPCRAHLLATLAEHSLLPNSYLSSALGCSSSDLVTARHAAKRSKAPMSASACGVCHEKLVRLPACWGRLSHLKSSLAFACRSV